MTNVSTAKKIMVPVIILIITIIIVQVIIKNPPESNRGKGIASAQMAVEVLSLTPQTYSVILNSFGTVKPRTQSVLVSQVSGQINDVSPQFRDGGFFEKGDILVAIDDRDHQAEVKISQASLMSAKQALLEEEAKVEQALVDWQRLGNGKKPNALVLRKPQLAAAQAQVLSAQASLAKAQLVLERSKVIAPYAGRILKKQVDLGQVVANNTQLADIYAVDYVEIRLPINNRDLDFIVLPEEYRHNNKDSAGSSVILTSNLIGKQRWQGKVVRTEGAIDENSQQLYIVAQIDDPYGAKTYSNTSSSTNQNNNQSTHQNIAPIKIGQYVNANITGKTIKNALVIPNTTIRQGSYVYVVEKAGDVNVLKRKDINIRWQNSKEAIIDNGLQFGEQLVLTSLGQVNSGTRVNIINTDLLKRTPQNSPSSSKANVEETH